MVAAVEIRLIGRPVILDASGAERPVRGHQSWALLARILMADRPLTRRELSAELFPSADDPLGALRWCLAGLRRALGSAESFTGDPVVPGLPADTVVDLHELDSGTVDLSYATGLLAGVDPRCSPEFDTWLMIQRHRVAGQVDTALRAEVRRRLTGGAFSRAVDLATLGVQRAVFDEGTHVLLLQGLVAMGADDVAAAHVTATTELFRRELGHEPTTALRDAARPRLAAPPPGVSRRAVVVSSLESGRAALAAGAAEAGVELLRRASQDGEDVGDQQLAAACLLELGSALVHSVRSHDDEGVTLLHRSATIAASIGDDRVAAQALRELGYVDALAGRRPSAAEHLQRAEVHAGDDPSLLAGILSIRGFNLGDWGKFDEAGQAYTRALDLARRARSARREAWTLGTGAWVLLAAGDIARAQAWADASLVRAETLQWVAFRPWPTAVLAETELADGGITPTTRTRLDEAYALSCSLGDPCWEGATARAISLTHAAHGRRTEARAWIDQALTRSRRATDTYAAVQAAILTTSAEQAGAAGDGPRAEFFARSLLALSARAHLDHYLPRAIALLDAAR
ncbi:DNA-binding SARP family transcriptional activator [Arthrobacter agilis]|nr:DNA-binding SARP family transcriptional activator [Arthrobacter agilis]